MGLVGPLRQPPNNFRLANDAAREEIGLSELAQVVPPLFGRAQSLYLSRATSLARIIHIFEDNKSLICYKHVVETVFEAETRLLNV